MFWSIFFRVCVIYNAKKKKKKLQISRQPIRALVLGCHGSNCLATTESTESSLKTSLVTHTVGSVVEILLTSLHFKGLKWLIYSFPVFNALCFSISRLSLSTIRTSALMLKQRSRWDEKYLLWGQLIIRLLSFSLPILLLSRIVVFFLTFCPF